MPNLQMHQLRVAGVANLIGTAMSGQTIDINNITLACLLHDMGNIIKFKLDAFPEFLKPEGLDYWIGVQKEYIDRYGTDEHVATMRIARQVLIQDSRFRIHESERILELVDAIGFLNAKANFETNDFGKKIASYADMRVKPQGVTSLAGRLEDGRTRFSKRQKYYHEAFETMSAYLQKIEDQIFSKSHMSPNDITEEAVRVVIPKLQQDFHTQPIDRKDH